VRELGVTLWLTDRSVAVTDLARAVERAGLGALFLTSHTHVPSFRRDIFADEDREDARLLDQFTALGAAAAVTSSLKLGTCVCIFPQHDRSSSPSRWRRSITCRGAGSSSESAPGGSARSCETTVSSPGSGGG
jgi:hypothetical protein